MTPEPVDPIDDFKPGDKVSIKYDSGSGPIENLVMDAEVISIGDDNSMLVRFLETEGVTGAAAHVGEEYLVPNRYLVSSIRSRPETHPDG